VFVSYDWSLPAHVEAVNRLIRQLASDGMHVRTPNSMPNAVFFNFEREFADTDFFVLARSSQAAEQPFGMVVLPTHLPGLPPTLEVVFPHLGSEAAAVPRDVPTLRIPEDYDELLQRIRGAVEPEPASPDPEALEDLAQAIALSDNFQLLALQCIGMDTGSLLHALDGVRSRVHRLCEVPPLPIVYNPYLCEAGQGSARGEAWVREILGSIAELAPPSHDEASLVAVVNGLAYDPRNYNEVDAWRVLLQQMNERRNALARTFRGTLLLAFPTSLLKLLFEVAPDLASIRSGSIRLHPSVVPADPKPVPDLSRWYDRSLIQEAELRRRAQDPAAPSQAAEQARLELEAVRALKQTGDAETANLEPLVQVGEHARPALADRLKPAPRSQAGERATQALEDRSEKLRPVEKVEAEQELEDRTQELESTGAIEAAEALSQARQLLEPAPTQTEASAEEVASQPLHFSDLLTRTLGAPASKSFSGAKKPGAPSDSARTKQLAGLLTRLLTNADMWDFAQQLSKGAQLELPTRASGHELAHAIILDAQRQGRIDRYFFEFLADAHPRHADEIWQLAASWGVSAEKRAKLRGKLRGPVARDAVHAALLRLTRPQLEQVVRLVWGRVPWMRGKRKLSARDLLRHATALGSDGLSQLQDAVDVVTR